MFADKYEEEIKDIVKGIQKSLAYIAESTAKVPREMSREFDEDMKRLIDSINVNL